MGVLIATYLDPCYQNNVCTVHDFMEDHINISLVINLVKKSASPLYCAPLVNVSCWFLAKLHCFCCMGHLVGTFFAESYSKTALFANCYQNMSALFTANISAVKITLFNCVRVSTVILL